MYSNKPYTCCEQPNQFWTKKQQGYGILPDGRVYFSGVRRQKGAGLGGVFGAIARRLLPFAKKFILPHAKTALQGLATDLTNPEVSFKQSLKNRGVSALKDIGKGVFNQTGSGRRRGNNPKIRSRRKLRKLVVKKKSKPKFKKLQIKKTKQKGLRYLF